MFGKGIKLTQKKPATPLGRIVFASCIGVIVICVIFLAVWYFGRSTNLDEEYNIEIKHIVSFVGDWYSEVGGESLPDVWRNNVDLRCQGKTCSLTTSGGFLRAEYPDGAVKYCRLKYTSLFFDDQSATGRTIPCVITRDDGTEFTYTVQYRSK